MSRNFGTLTMNFVKSTLSALSNGKSLCNLNCFHDFFPSKSKFIFLQRNVLNYFCFHGKLKRFQKRRSTLILFKFSQIFRKSNILLLKALISRNIFSMRWNFSFFQQCAQSDYLGTYFDND